MGNWLADHLPVWCFNCKYVMFAKNAKYTQSTIGGHVVPLCSDCHALLFHPLGR